jgi:hypothetical protein
MVLIVDGMIPVCLEFMHVLLQNPACQSRFKKDKTVASLACMYSIKSKNLIISHWAHSTAWHSEVDLSRAIQPFAFFLTSIRVPFRKGHVTVLAQLRWPRNFVGPAKQTYPARFETAMYP